MLLCYKLLRGNWKTIGQMVWFKKIAAVTLARPFGYIGDSARPIPFEELVALIDAQYGPVAVGPCFCRMWHKACSHPMETDIVFRTGFLADGGFARKY